LNTSTDINFSQTTLVHITDPINTTPITSIPGSLVTSSFNLDNISPIQDIVLSLDNFVFDDKTKTIEKRRSKKRKMTHHEEITQEVTQLWNVAHLDDEEFAEEVVDALGAFSNANKWSVMRLSNQLRKEKNIVKELVEQQRIQEYNWQQKHETEVKAITKENNLSQNIIAELTTKIDAIKIEHDRELVTFVTEKEKINKDYQKQIDTLTTQLEEVKIRNESSKS
jgi:hypothetical protein